MKVFGYLILERVVGEHKVHFENSLDLYSKKLDIIGLYAAAPREDGSITNLDQFDALIKEIRERFKDKKVILSVGCGTAKILANIARDKSHTEDFLKNLGDIVTKYDLDGVDVDWEYPTYLEYGKYLRFMRKIYKEFHTNRNGIVSAAITPNPTFIFGNLRCRNLFKYVDFLNLMAYTNLCSDDHSSLSWAKTMTFLTSLVPYYDPEKVYLGVPFYALQSRGCCGCCNMKRKDKYFRDIPPANILPSQDVFEFGGVPFIFNGVDTMKKKVDYAKKKGMGGVMIWEITQDSLDHQLLNVIYDNK